jgi:acyl dehydratase
MTGPVTRRTFSMADQQAFARLSGDSNPLHLDAVAARRTMFGRPLVHGIHQLLWAIDMALVGRNGPVALGQVAVTFSKPLGVGEAARCEFRELDGTRIECLVIGDDAPLMEATISVLRAAAPAAPPVADGGEFPAVPKPLTAEDLDQARGTLDLHYDASRAARLFPNAAAVLPPRQIATLLATTRLVGMECPGLHSVFAGARLEFDPLADGASPLDWQVERLDRRFGQAQIQVASSDVSGTLKAFLRPPPRAQASFETLGQLVSEAEFHGQTALVVGGSRGLGEVSAKLLAAGGADVVLTYQQGRLDAAGVTDDIIAGGGTARCIPYDVLAGPGVLEQALGSAWQPTHLYSFATPHIFSASKGVFSKERLMDFCAFYVDGFVKAASVCVHMGARRILYPSSVAIDDLPTNMGEYAAAKAAGEAAAGFLARCEPDLVVHCPRLPRVATDQTATMLPVRTESAGTLMLQHLRALDARSGED